MCSKQFNQRWLQSVVVHFGYDRRSTTCPWFHWEKFSAPCRTGLLNRLDEDSACFGQLSVLVVAICYCTVFIALLYSLLSLLLFPRVRLCFPVPLFLLCFWRFNRRFPSPIFLIYVVSSFSSSVLIFHVCSTFPSSPRFASSSCSSPFGCCRCCWCCSSCWSITASALALAGSVTSSHYYDLFWFVAKASFC